MADLGKSSTGMEPNLAGLLAYVLGVVSGLVFFLIEKENTFVKFHAMQAILLSLTLFVLGFVLMFIPAFGWILGVLINLGGLALWIVCMIKAYQGEWFKRPVIGDIAAQQVGGTGGPGAGGSTSGTA